MMSNIPKFDRREVDAGRLAYSGSVDDSEVILHVGDEITHVVKARVTAVSFRENQFGVMRRIHSIKVDHAMPAADDVATQLAAEIKRQQDDAAGQESLDEQLDQETER